MSATKTFGYGVTAGNYTPNTYGVNDTTAPNIIGKVAQQIIREVQANNPLSVFDKVLDGNGDTIEQVVVKLAESTAYDANSYKKAFAPEDVDRLAVRYFKNWTPYLYEAMIKDAELKKVMLPGTNKAEIADRIVASLVEGDKQDKFESMKALLEYGRVNAVFKNAGTIEYSGTAGVPNYKGILKAIKNTVKGMTFVNTDFNTASIKRSTRLDDIYIIMSYKLKNDMDIDELASVFNLDKTEMGARIIEIDTDVIEAVDDTAPYVIYIVDRNAILSYTGLYEMTDPEHNRPGRFWKYYLNVDRLFALSQLFDGCYLLANTQPAEV